MCVQLSSSAESESLASFPWLHPIFHYFQQSLLKHQSIWIRILLDDNYSKKWSPSKHFSSGACLPYVDLLHEHACNKLHAICDPYLTREWVKQLLVCQELHNIWDLGPKNGLRSNLLASEFFSGELHSYPPRDTVCRLWPHHLLLWPDYPG